MRSVINFLGLAVIAMLSACIMDGDEGPPGPRGIPGPGGQAGEPGEEAFVFDFEGVSFVGPEYEVILPYTHDFVALATDVTLVYFLWAEEETAEGDVVEVWRPLPQSVITEDGLLQYNYDFSVADVRLFLTADYPLSLVRGVDTDNWIVRLVVVPGQYLSGRREYPAYEDVQKLFKR